MRGRPPRPSSCEACRNEIFPAAGNGHGIGAAILFVERQHEPVATRRAAVRVAMMRAKQADPVS